MQYPAVELLTAIVFYSSYLKWIDSYKFDVWSAGALFLWIVFWALFIVIIVYDIRHKIIPDKLSYALAVVGLIFLLAYYSEHILESILLAVGLFVFFAALWFISRGMWMGLGDAKLFFGTGLFLGWPLGVVAVLFSFWAGALIGGLLILIKKGISLKTEIPFAPFIFAGALTAFFYGERIVEWYLLMTGL